MYLEEYTDDKNFITSQKERVFTTDDSLLKHGPQEAQAVAESLRAKNSRFLSEFYQSLYHSNEINEDQLRRGLNNSALFQLSLDKME